ncbi:hypothetical protein DRJ24_04630 [Candidatus Acetothermia bacterium]|nr:MAG: hypothetical protein DRJ24_04630 [Candidatus Acetothermia bacterium]
MSPIRILIHQSDRKMAELLEGLLSSAGYDVAVAEGIGAVQGELGAGNVDFLLLRIDRPEGEGWDLLDSIVAGGNPIPVMVVTSLSRAEDRIRALESGADDVISIPFNPDELKARVGAIVRRTLAPARSGLDLWIDDLRKEVRVSGRRIILSPKEYALLKLLHSSAGRVFSAGEIRRRLWPRGHATVQDVQKYIYLLRRKIEEDPKDPRVILTVRGFGYRLAA